MESMSTPRGKSMGSILSLSLYDHRKLSQHKKKKKVGITTRKSTRDQLKSTFQFGWRWCKPFWRKPIWRGSRRWTIITTPNEAFLRKPRTTWIWTKCTKPLTSTNYRRISKWTNWEPSRVGKEWLQGKKRKTQFCRQKTAAKQKNGKKKEIKVSKKSINSLSNINPKQRQLMRNRKPASQGDIKQLADIIFKIRKDLTS